MTNKSLLTTKEAADFLRLSINTVWSWTSQGKISVVKLGRKNFYREEDLTQLVEAGYRAAIESPRRGTNE